MGKAGQYARFKISSDWAGEVRPLRGKRLCEEQLPEGRTGAILWLHDTPSSRADGMRQQSFTPMDRANEEVLAVLERDVLHPDVTKTVVRKALDKFRASERDWSERRQALHKRIAIVDMELSRLVTAISSGGDIPALVEAVKATNDRRTTLSRELAEVDSQQHFDADYDQLERELQAHFEASWKTVLTRQVGPTRQILCKLFNGDRLPFIPMTNESGSQYEFKGTASIGRLLTGRAKGLVSPTGFSIGGTDPLGFRIDVRLLVA